MDQSILKLIKQHRIFSLVLVVNIIKNISKSCVYTGNSVDFLSSNNTNIITLKRLPKNALLYSFKFNPCGIYHYSLVDNNDTSHPIFLTKYGHLFTKHVLNKNIYNLTISIVDSNTKGKIIILVQIVLVDPYGDQNLKFSKLYDQIFVETYNTNAIYTAQLLNEHNNENCPIIYSLNGGSGVSLFSIDRCTGQIYMLPITKPILFSYYLIIQAFYDHKVQPMFTKMYLKINIDYFDNYYQLSFSNSTYRKYINENIPIGSFIMCAKLHLSLGIEFHNFSLEPLLLNDPLTDIPSNDTNYFIINQSNGCIFTNALIDYEKNQIFLLKVNLLHTNQQFNITKQSFAILHIYVNDQNDNSPVFLSESQSLTINKIFDPSSPVLCASLSYRLAYTKASNGYYIDSHSGNFTLVNTSYYLHYPLIFNSIVNLLYYLYKDVFIWIV